MPGFEDILTPKCVAEREKEGSNFLNEYKRSEEISKLILAEFSKKFDSQRGFAIDDNSEKYGLISNIMALSTFLELESLDASLKDHEEMICKLIGLIFDSISSNEYSASPYFEAEVVDFTETLSKVLIAMVDLRSYILRKGFKSFYSLTIKFKPIKSNDDLLVQVERIIVDCISRLCSSCLDIATPFEFTINDAKVKRLGYESSIVNYRGWTYRNVDNSFALDYGTSIYFTYHATNAFLSFYQTFINQFNSKYVDNNEQYPVPANSTEKETYIHNANTDFFVRNLDIIDEFRRKVIDSGRYIEHKLARNNVNIALDYVNNALSPVSFEEIKKSRSSNDVVNTLFTLAILINSGVDEDYEAVGQKDVFYEQIQFSLNNIKKIYTIFKKDSIDDIIDSYRIVFDERYPKEEKSNLQEYRKHCSNIEVYGLVPLFCNTYATISKYLICYPQKEMVDNLALVMENRSKKAEWLWSRDGYNINNNLYYIFAIENFYDYYNIYELPLSERGARYNAKALDAKNKLTKAEALNAELEEKYAKLQSDYDSKQSMLDNEVYKIAEKMFNDKISDAIASYLNSMLEESITLALNVAKKKRNSSTYSAPDNVFDAFPKAKILYEIALAENYQTYAVNLKDKLMVDSATELNKSFKSALSDKIYEKLNNRN